MKIVTPLDDIPDDPSSIELEGTVRILVGGEYRAVTWYARLDMAGLTSLIQKAASNKTGRSAGGPLVVKVKSFAPAPDPSS